MDECRDSAPDLADELADASCDDGGNSANHPEWCRPARMFCSPKGCVLNCPIAREACAR